MHGASDDATWPQVIAADAGAGAAANNTTARATAAARIFLAAVVGAGAINCLVDRRA
jgi:hypothetical protein